MMKHVALVMIMALTASAEYHFPTSMMQADDKAEPASMSENKAEQSEHGQQVQAMIDQGVQELKYWLDHPQGQEADRKSYLDMVKVWEERKTKLFPQKPTEVVEKATEQVEKAMEQVKEVAEQVKPAALVEAKTEHRMMLASEANELLRTTSKLFKRSLKRWERAETDILALLLKDANGPNPIQQTAAKNIVHRAQTAQLELVGLAGQDKSFLEAAQHRMMAVVAKEASGLIEARGESYPSLDKCTSPGLSNTDLAMDAMCVCIADKTCSFVGNSDSKNCNYLAQASCIGPEYMP